MNARANAFKQRSWLAGMTAAGCLVAALLLPASPGLGEDEARATSEITPRTARAIRRGLDVLARNQDATGALKDGIGRKVNQTYLHHRGQHVGVTSLAGIAWLSNGSVPGRGRYGRNVSRAVDFIMRSTQNDGFVTNDQSRMYSHAFATLFLAEVYGMAPSPRVREKLRAATRLIVYAQNDQGGWRYLPGAKDSDISISVCQVQALRAARNVGIEVPRESIDRAIRYVKASYIHDYPHPNYKGGFWYQVFENQPFRPSRTSFALTSAGVTALYGAGDYDSPEIQGGLRYLFNSRNWPHASDMHRTFDYFYGHYYAVQAFYQASGRYWDVWYPRIRDEILGGQHPDGKWEDLVGPNYATAMACVILQIPYRYLPIFER